jgi:NADH dehydrogenase
VATAGLAAPDIAQPIRSILRKKPNLTVRMDEVKGLDLATLVDAKGMSVPGIAPAAMQMGAHVARELAREIRAGGRSGPRAAFAYWDKGNMATIGRSAAVAQISRFQFSGWLAWAAWLGVHLIFLVGFRNKVAVFFQWTYSYFTYRRGARIITGMDARDRPGPSRA